MNTRDWQICQKLLSESQMLHSLLEGYPLEAFLGDERTIRAASMTLINIGELVKNLTENFRQAHREIPWRAIAGMRDVSAHKYQTLRKEDVYTTCTEDVPEFAQQIEALLLNDPTGVERYDP
ncbi:MAG: DUF86 domain-containing protein [Clostridia bacterium]|nr:DUF86 domain-containing protein [Clostridia bacterium]